MSDDLTLSFESFLVEDVILTLGNLRGSLGWLGAGPADADPARHRAGLDRLARQIELLDDRARAVCRQIRAARAAPDGGSPQTIRGAAGPGGEGGTDAPLLLCDPCEPGAPANGSAGRAEGRGEGRGEDGASVETAILDAVRDNAEGGDAESDGPAAPVFRTQRG